MLKKTCYLYWEKEKIPVPQGKTLQEVAKEIFPSWERIMAAQLEGEIVDLNTKGRERRQGKVF